MDNSRNYGELAYEVYAEAMGTVCLMGSTDRPTWQELPPEWRRAWEMATQRAIEAYCEDEGLCGNG